MRCPKGNPSRWESFPASKDRVRRRKARRRCSSPMVASKAHSAGAVWKRKFRTAPAAAPLALQLNFEVTVFEDRPTLVTSQYLPAGTKFRVDYWEKRLKESLLQRSEFGLIFTRGHQFHALVLREWASRPFVFLGL